MIEINNLNMLLFIAVAHLILEQSKSDVVVANQRKSFKAIRSANLTLLCAIDTPTEVIRVEDLNLQITNVASPSPETLCAWKCTRESNCTGFNWKQCNKECEFYSYVPKTCEVISGCTHYGINGSTGHESCQVAPAPAIPTPMPCPSNCSLYGQWCYYVCNTPTDFETALQSCEAKNASLVSISDDQENDFVISISQKLTGQDYWIGLYKNKSSKTSATFWLDGNPATYRHWASGEPDEDSKCVRIATNRVWRDRDCTSLYSWICKVSSR